MQKFELNNILKIKEISNEIELEKATSIFLILRKSKGDFPDYPGIMQHLQKLILEYEQEHWTDEKKITDEQIDGSDLAEAMQRAENEFNYKRKELIRSKLRGSGLNQNDLARILGHRKGYMSELMNGLRPFSKEDLVIINKLLNIDYTDLVPPFIKQEKANRIIKILNDIPKSKLKLNAEDFIVKFA